MKLFIENRISSLWLSLNVLRWVGFLVPEELAGWARRLYPWYAFVWFMFVLGIYLITEVGEMVYVWGNAAAVTNVLFLLIINMCFTTKVCTVLLRRDQILAIIDEGEQDLITEGREEGQKIIKSVDKETKFLHAIYLFFISLTVFGWAASSDTKQLPLPAWFPYDTTKSPVHEITYAQQIAGVFMVELVSVSIDQMVISLTAICRCRLKLVSLSLTTVCEDLGTIDQLLTKDQEETAYDRLRRCVVHHQSVLDSAVQIQRSFSEPLLAQFTVSTVMICVTAYQSALETGNNWGRVVSMAAYLSSVAMQVFLYCYQGHHLTKESEEVADAAYECSWYLCSSSFKRTLMVMMTRCRRVAVLTAGGLTTLSLSCFVAIIKASYSFYTVLSQTENSNYDFF